MILMITGLKLLEKNTDDPNNISNDFVKDEFCPRRVLFIIDSRRVLLSNTNTTTNADNNDSSTSSVMFDPSIFGCD